MVGKKTEDKAVGRTRGGLNTKLHAIVDGLGNPVEFLLSAGNDNDCVHAIELLENVELSGSNVLADRAYGAQSIREYISEHGAIVFPRKLPRRLPAFLAVWCGQTETEAALADLKGHAALTLFSH